MKPKRLHWASNAVGRLMLIAVACVDASAARGQQPAPFVIEKDAAYCASFGDQFYGGLTAGPGEYFAVWIDLRVGGLSGGGYDLYGQRVLPDGTVAAPGSIKLLRDATRQATGIPAVAWNGTAYLVTWYEYPGPTLWGMRVKPDGTPLDADGFIIGARPGSFFWPSVASDGTGFLVVDVSSGQVLATRVAGDGTVLDLQPLVLMGGGATGLGYPKAAFGGDEYLVAWAQAPNQSIRGCRVLPDGTVLEPGGFNISGGPAGDVDAHVDFDGSRFYVVWLRDGGTVNDLWGVHVATDGTPDTPSLVTSGSNFPGGCQSSDIAFNGTNHLAAITTGEPVFSTADLWGQVIDIGGAPVGGPFGLSRIGDGFNQVSYGAASTGSQFFVLWEGNRLPGIYFVYDTQGARVTNDGIVLDAPEPIQVSASAAWQINSALSFDGDNFLCVFEDWREGIAGEDYGPDYVSDLYAVRVAANGRPVDATAFLVAGDLELAQQEPDATFGGGQHVVVYENRSATGLNEVRMVRVLPDGTVLDPGPLLVFANEPTAETYRPKVAWNGQKYCVVWYDNYFPAGSGQKPLQFALMRTDGTREIGPVNIGVSDGADLLGFEIGSNGDEFLVVWTGPDRVRATRISNAGVVLGTQTLQTTGNWITESARVAFNGQSYLAAWTRYGDAGATVYARRVASNGVPLGTTFKVAGPEEGGAWPAEILVSGTDFLLIGQRRDVSYDGNEGAFVQRIDANGNLVGAAASIYAGPIAASYGNFSYALGSCGRALAVGPLWADMPYNAPRVQGLLFPVGAACRGDMNCDGTVNPFDIQGFITALTSAAAYEAAYPNCFRDNADADANGTVNPFDIQPFIALLMP